MKKKNQVSNNADTLKDLTRQEDKTDVDSIGNQKVYAVDVPKISRTHTLLWSSAICEFSRTQSLKCIKIKQNWGKSYLSKNTVCWNALHWPRMLKIESIEQLKKEDVDCGKNSTSLIEFDLYNITANIQRRKKSLTNEFDPKFCWPDCAALARSCSRRLSRSETTGQAGAHVCVNLKST